MSWNASEFVQNHKCTVAALLGCFIRRCLPHQAGWVQQTKPNKETLDVASGRIPTHHPVLFVPFVVECAQRVTSITKFGWEKHIHDVLGSIRRGEVADRLVNCKEQMEGIIRASGGGAGSSGEVRGPTWPLATPSVTSTNRET